MGCVNKKLILIGPWAPPSGGVATHLFDLYNNLRLTTNYQIALYGFGQFQPSPSVNKITFSLKKPVSTAKSFKYLYSNLSTGSIIHTHSLVTARPIPLFTNNFINNIQYRYCSWIETLHDETLIDRYPSFLKQQKVVYRNINSKITKLILVSKSLKNFMLTIGLDSNKLEYINPLLPLDYLDLFKSSCSLPSYVSNFIGHRQFIITTIGAFIPSYDFKTIVEAFLNFHSFFPDSVLLILETSFAVDRDYKQKVMSLIKNNTSVMILSNLSREIVLYLLAQSSIFVRGCLHDSFGLSKVESLLMGTPVICTNSGETRFMTTYQYSDKRDLLEKINYVLHHINTAQIEQAKIFYQQMAQDNFKKIINIYDSLYK